MGSPTIFKTFLIYMRVTQGRLPENPAEISGA